MYRSVPQRGIKHIRSILWGRAVGVVQTRDSFLHCHVPIHHHVQHRCLRRVADGGGEEKALAVGGDVVQEIGLNLDQVSFEQGWGTLASKEGFVPGLGTAALTATSIIFPSAATKNSSLPSPRQRGCTKGEHRHNRDNSSRRDIAMNDGDNR